MRIDSNQPVSNQVALERSARNSGKADGEAGAHSEGATFSADTGGVAGLEARVLSTPEIRQDRVAALRESIRSGSYSLDPGQIADAMLNESAR
jgi:flagellar biosynthesis anti-sigma factor FlgM